MKILREGVIPITTKRFECSNCGCIFEADENEYEMVSNQMEFLESNGASYKIICPTCGHTVYCK